MVLAYHMCYHCVLQFSTSA